MEKDNEIRKSYWSDAAVNGGLAGLFFTAILYINTLAGSETLSKVMFVMEIAGFLTFSFITLKRRSMKYGDYGFSYSQSLGYMMAMMLFTGFIYGIANYLLLNYVSPEYYQMVYERAVTNNAAVSGNSEMIAMAEALLRSGLFWIVVGIVTMLFYGGIVGLLVSPFVKRNPHFKDHEREE